MANSSNWRPPPDSGGYLITKLNIALIVISSVIVLARLNIRFALRSIGVDDLIAVIGFILVVTTSALEIKAVSHGSGTHMDEVPWKQIVLFYSNLVDLQLVFFVAVAAVRFSIIAFQLKLSSNRWFRFSLGMVGFCNLTITLITFFYFLAECTPFWTLWDITAADRKCASKSQEKLIFWSHGVVGIIIDAALLIIPIWIVSTSMKFSEKMLQIILIFCIGIFAVVAGIIRVYYSMTVDFSTETTYKMLLVAPWTDLEIHIGLWVACFPAFQPMIRIVRQKLGHGTKNSERKTSGRDEPSHSTTGVGSDWPSTRTSRHAQFSMPFHDRSTDQSSVSVTCKRNSRVIPDTDAMELRGMRGIPGIVKETSITVHVADSNESRPQSRDTMDDQTQPESWNAV